MVAIGGASGAVLRYGTLQISGTHQQWAVVAVNALGCMAVALLYAYESQSSSALTPQLKQLLVVGFLGSFTTFSAVFDILLRSQEQLSTTAIHLLLPLLCGYLVYRLIQG